MLLNSAEYLDLSPNIVNNVTYLEPLRPGKSSILSKKISAIFSILGEKEKPENEDESEGGNGIPLTIAEKARSFQPQLDVHPEEESEAFKLQLEVSSENCILLADKDQSNVAVA